MLSGKEALIELSAQLRGESLIVTSEFEQLQQLNGEVTRKLTELLQVAWISRQQQLIVSKFVNSSMETVACSSCRDVKIIEKTKFLPSTKVLGRYDSLIADLIRCLTNNSQVVADLLHALDTNLSENGPSVPIDFCHSLFTSIYGCCVFSADEKLVAETLQNLMRLQLLQHSNPRRLLRRGNCAFSRLYRLLNEGVFSAKVFLTCALHEPIMDVLSMDDSYLDVDPNKTLVHFTLPERLSKFGEENSSQFRENFTAYRKGVVRKLVNLSQKFIASIKASLHCFPPLVSFLVRCIHAMLLNKGEVNENEAALISIDLIFTYFICPAIANPESLGIISDTPINPVARFNLMQIGQILQSLAIAPYDKSDVKLPEVYSQFDPTCVSGIVQTLLTGAPGNITLDDIYTSSPNSLVIRQIAMITISDLNILISTLRRFLTVTQPTGDQWKDVKDLLDKIPEHFATLENANSNSNSGSQRSASNSPISSTSFRRAFKLPRPRVPHINRSPSGERSAAWPSSSSDGCDPGAAAASPVEETSIAEVLVLNLSVDSCASLNLISEENYLNTLKGSGEKSQDGSAAPADRVSAKRTRFDLDSLGTGNSDQLEASSDEEQSVSSSLEGMGTQDTALMNDNFSDVDGLPISANVSGRGSPNISGRDTPLSGHTEHQEEEEANREDREEEEPSASSHSGGGPPKEERPMPQLPTTGQKENRADIEEKFFKFEIPQPHRRERHRDETHSLVSDSWSTDVLASDSEFGVDAQALTHNVNHTSSNPSQAHHGGGVLPDLVPGQAPDIPRLDLIAEEIVISGERGPVVSEHRQVTTAASASAHLEVGGLCDRSDTWSVDATASDSDADAMRNDERMKEFDEIAGTASGPGSVTGSVSSTVDNNFGSTNVMSNTSASMKVFEEKQHQDARRHSSGCFSIAKSDSDSNEAFIATTTEKYEPRLSEPAVASFSSLMNQHQPKLTTASDNNSVSTVAESTVPVDGSGFAQRSVAVVTCGTDQIGCTTSESALLTPKVDESAAIDRWENKDSNKKFEKSGSKEQSQASSNNNANQFLHSTASDTIGKSQSEIYSAPGGAIPKRSLRSTASATTGEARRSNLAAVGSRHVEYQTIPSGGVEKEDKKRNFFKTFKLPNLKSKVHRSATDHSLVTVSCHINGGDPSVTAMNRAALAAEGAVAPSTGVTRTTSLEFASSAASGEIGEEILAKYRRSNFSKPTTINVSDCDTSGAGENPLENGKPVSSSSSLLLTTQNQQQQQAPKIDVTNASSTNVPYYDSSNVTNCQAFIDVKRKLRMVLSSVNFGTLPVGMNSSQIFSSNLKSPKETELIQYLKVLLAEAVNTKQKFLSSQLQEVLRCLALFEVKGIRKLVRALHEEHRHRGAYLTYLQQFRLNLLQSRSYLDKLINRVQREQTLSLEWLIEFCVRLYLDQHCERQLRSFSAEFKDIQVQDEKTEFVERFLHLLHGTMLKDQMWQGASDDQLQYARLCVERYVMALIYVCALYPNGDADMFRDQVFFEAIKRLSAIITPSHKDLRIPVELHAECPWPLAQAEISIMNAYKTPRDRLGCVLRCCETIVNLLRVSRYGKTPSADDVVPVLVFVLIKANPPSLLSTVQYINGFYGKRLQGEEAYWWTQFCAAVEFIKIMVNYNKS